MLRNTIIVKDLPHTMDSTITHFKKNTHPRLIALFIALTLVLTKFMLYLFEMTAAGYIYRVLQHES